MWAMEFLRRNTSGDDYKGYDLKGKVALLFVNEPTSDDPNFFKGKALTYYGRGRTSMKRRRGVGAIATLIIHRTAQPVTVAVVRNSWGGEEVVSEAGWHAEVGSGLWIRKRARKLVGRRVWTWTSCFRQRSREISSQFR